MFVVPGIVFDARRDRMVIMVLIKIRAILTRMTVSIISLILITPFDLLVGTFTISLVSMVANGVDSVVFFSLSTLFHCVPLCSTVYLLGTR